MTAAAHAPQPGPTRFHFVSGPGEGGGAAGLLRVLAQNPRFAVREASGALPLFDGCTARCTARGTPEAYLRPAQQRALLRGLFEAVHHDHPPGCAVFDSDPGWIDRAEALSALFPLARFLLVMRHASLGHPVLGGPLADRVVTIDALRLARDPESVFEDIYHALREPPVMHDFAALRLPEADFGAVFRPRRGLRALFGSARADRRHADATRGRRG